MSSPLCTKSRTVVLPIPVFDPVTIAVLPSSRAVPLYREQIIVWLHSRCPTAHAIRWWRTSQRGRQHASASWKYLQSTLNVTLSLSFKLHVTTQQTHTASDSGRTLATPYLYRFVSVRPEATKWRTRICWVCLGNTEYRILTKNWLTWLRTRGFYFPGHILYVILLSSNGPLTAAHHPFMTAGTFYDVLDKFCSFIRYIYMACCSVLLLHNFLVRFQNYFVYITTPKSWRSSCNEK